jgi:hypothetical protein
VDLYCVLVFKLINLDKNLKICYVCEANPAWLQVLKLKDLPNWTRPLEDKMKISQAIDQTAKSLEKTDWKQIAIKIIKIWDLFFRRLAITIILTYLVGKSLGNWVHRLNDWLAHHWVRLIVPQTTAETGQATIVVEEVSNTPLPVKVEPMLPPAPLVVQDPWEATIEVELTLPLKPLAILFTAPLMIAATQAPVALLAPAPQEQQKPARRRRRQSAQPAVVATEELELLQKRRPRGRRAHQEERKKARQAA